MDHYESRSGKKNSSKQRGSVNNGNRLEAFAKRTTKGAADWGDCDPAKMQAVVVGMTDLGGAVTFGLSRNQGAHSVTMMLEKSRETVWFNGDAPLDDEMDDVIAAIETIRLATLK